MSYIENTVAFLFCLSMIKVTITVLNDDFHTLLFKFLTRWAMTLCVLVLWEGCKLSAGTVVNQPFATACIVSGDGDKIQLTYVRWLLWVAVS